MNMFEPETLNEFLSTYIQEHGITFVIEHFLELREEYYARKDANDS